MNDHAPRRRLLIASAALLGALLLAWWPALGRLAERWSEPQYAHGWMVPALAASLLWWRRRPRELASFRASWIGAPIIAGSVAVQFLGEHWHVDLVESGSLIPALAGAALCLGGGAMLRWIAPALALLPFMLPLPYALESTVSLGLQQAATLGAAAMLRALGCMATATGNVLHIDGLPLGVAEACSGLRMLTVLLAIAVFSSMLGARPIGRRLAMIVVAAPLAVAVNALRIAATALVYREVRSPNVLATCHDVAGWIMPAAAVALLWAFVRFLDSVTWNSAPAGSSASISRTLGFGRRSENPGR